MTFGEAILSGYRNFAVFSGRATVPEYWHLARFSQFANLILVAAILFYAFTATTRWMDRMASLSDGQAIAVTQPPLLGGSIWLLAAIPLVVSIPLAACAVRRLHDTGRSGWHYLVPSAVALTLLATAYLLIVPRDIPPFQAFLLLFTPIWFFEPRLLLGVAAFVAVMAMIRHNLHRKLRDPSQPGPNRYGPNPNEVSP